jgi:hypothetical protein
MKEHACENAYLFMDTDDDGTELAIDAPPGGVF